jgi:hypothetical protein
MRVQQAFVSRLRHLLSHIYNAAQQLGFVNVPVQYQLTNNPLSANHSFRMLLMFEVPPSPSSSTNAHLGQTLGGLQAPSDKAVQDFEQLFDMTETYVDQVDNK